MDSASCTAPRALARRALGRLHRVGPLS